MKGWLGADNLPMSNWRHLFFLLLFLLHATRPMAAHAAVVSVDVGHGLQDSGALSARGRAEFDFNRDLAVHLTKALRSRELRVREVNFDGQNSSLTQRPLAGLGSDLFVSVHHDSIDPEFLLPWTWRGRTVTHTVVKRGFGLFVSSRNPDLATSLRCAVLMGRLLRRAGFVPTPWHARKHKAADADNGVWYYDTLLVLGSTTVPAVLLEAGVIRHRDEELQLMNPTRQARMADALASATAACLSVSSR